MDFDAQSIGPAKQRFRQTDGQTPIGDIVRRMDQAFLDGRQADVLHVQLGIEINERGVARHLAMLHFKIFAAAQVPVDGSQNHHKVAFSLEIGGRKMFDIFNYPEHANDGRGIDGAAGVLIVETDIAACNGRVKRPAGLRDADHRFGELVVNFGIVGIAEIEAVGDGHRFGPGADHVAGRFRHGNGPT